MGNIFFKRILPRGTEKTNHAVVAPLPVSQAEKLPFFTKKLTLAAFFLFRFSARVGVGVVGFFALLFLTQKIVRCN